MFHHGEPTMVFQDGHGRRREETRRKTLHETLLETLHEILCVVRRLERCRFVAKTCQKKKTARN